MRGNAPRPQIHTPHKCAGYEPRGVWRQTHANCQSGQALVGTRQRRGEHGNSQRQDTQGGRDYTLCYDRITPHRAFRQQRRKRISVGRTKHINATHGPCGSSWHKLRGGQQQPPSHDASTVATPTAEKLSCSRNACMEDLHRTSGLCNYLYWNEDFGISGATLQKNRQILS